MKLPTTKQGCVELYEHRRETDVPMTKLDMYLGGMICCSEDELLYRKPVSIRPAVIFGDPCLCICYKNGDCNWEMSCVDGTDATLRMSWDGDLYES